MARTMTNVGVGFPDSVSDSAQPAPCEFSEQRSSPFPSGGGKREGGATEARCRTKTVPDLGPTSSSAKERHLLSSQAYARVNGSNGRSGMEMFSFLMRAVVMLVVCIAGLQGCSASPTVPDFYSLGSIEEQRTIGEYYRSEAAQFRQRADEMAERATAYRELFGEESEWVSGARALGEYYQREARERERLAEQYQSSSDVPVPPGVSPRVDRSSPN